MPPNPSGIFVKAMLGVVRVRDSSREKRLQSGADDGLANAAEGVIQGLHAASERRSETSAVVVVRAFIGADVRTRLWIGLRIGLRAIGVAGGRKGVSSGG